MDKRCIGTSAIGIRTPIIKSGDDLVKITVNSLLDAAINHNIKFNNKDIICLTEGIVAKAENNYATINDIALDIKNKFKSDHIGVVFPIFSRNRFSLCLKAVARATKKITLLLNFKGFIHPFTNVDIVDYYKNIILEENCKVEVIFSNNSKDILNYTKDILVSNVHQRYKTKKELISNANKLFLLSDILNTKINKSGFNSKYGLLGSNMATDNSLKLFPESGSEIVLIIQKEMKRITGKNFEVMVY